MDMKSLFTKEKSVKSPVTRLKTEIETDIEQLIFWKKWRLFLSHNFKISETENQK